MGRDKALMPFLGQPLIARVIDRLRAGLAARAPQAEIIVITNRPDDYRFLGAPLFGDPLPGEGPLGGLLAALQAARSPLAAVVACDMPFLNASLLLTQRDLLLTSAADVVIPRSEQGLEPLHAVYRAGACLPAVRAALASGQRRMTAWFEQVRVREMSLAETRAADPGGLSFVNVNSPEEFAWAEQEAARLAGH